MQRISEQPLADWILNGWISMDIDHKQYLHEFEPREIIAEWSSDGEQLSCETVFAGRFDIGPDWKKSLRRIVNGVIQEPLPEIAVDTPILTWDHNHLAKKVRHFAEFDDLGRAICWKDGKTSHTTDYLKMWLHYELLEGE